MEKIQTESASTDSASGSRRAGLVMAGIPASSVKLSIPADSLRKLPEGRRVPWQERTGESDRRQRRQREHRGRSLV
ncbi:hypothetical protein NXY15_20650 [Bacteroides thetaiotaomicron]|nr:hypothetical protein NXY15_20650 [Bacteroides thetaiotaomicron]